MPKRAQNPVKAAQTTFNIIDSLAESDGIGVTELANQLHISKGSVSNHLATLREAGYVVKDDSQYYLGCRFLRLGTIAQNRRLISDALKDHTSHLSKITNEQSGIVIEENGYGIYICTAKGKNEHFNNIIPGDRIPLHCTAPGKAILANLPANLRNSILDEYDQTEWTKVPVSNRKELQKEMRVIREQGLAINRGEYRSEENGLAAPIKVHNEVYGAIGIIGPDSRLSGKALKQDTAGLVISVAKDIEKVLE